tara:strand:+ start:3424 stop:4245 length:822 start_codon:yes stop_codon:yes gene_type:complete
MKKIVATSLIFFGLCGCASLTGSTDYGKPLNIIDVLNFSYQTSTDKNRFISTLANEIYNHNNFEQDLFAGDSSDDIKQKLEVELTKYFEGQDRLLLKKQSDDEVKYTRYVIHREHYVASNYDSMKQAYSLVSGMHRMSSLELKYNDKKSLNPHWSLRTTVNQEMLYIIPFVALEFTNPTYDWNVKPSVAAEYSYKANSPTGNIEYLPKIVTFAGESRFIIKDYNQVDLLNQIQDLSCTLLNEDEDELYNHLDRFQVKCEATNNVIKAYIATEM